MIGFMKRYTFFTDNVNRWLIGILLVVCIYAIFLINLQVGWIYGLVASFFPILLFFVFWILKKPYWSYALLFIVNYIISGVTRYIPIQGGIVMDVLIVLTFISLIIKSTYESVQWKRCLNSLLLLALIWLIYCVLELFNPEVVSRVAWVATARSVAIYFFVVAVLTPIIFYKFKDLKKVLFAWSLLTLLAVLKALGQKVLGFDPAENYWLYVSGGATTHIIYSGTRFFSFFTDAANFGSGMGMSMIVFTIVAYHQNKKWAKIYFLIVALAAGYGLLISGTRSALAVPFAGLAMYILISKNNKAITGGLIVLIGAFIFLNFTYIGQGNQYIRRMRSAFNSEDASFQVRLSNQAKIKTYMADKPFGVGIGLGGGKAKRYAPNAFMSQIPTDSWFVMIWVETGIVGLLIHLSIQLFIVVYGAYICMFKIKNKELKGITSALIAGIFGMLVSSYGNEIFTQLPNGIVICMCQAFIFIALKYDKELENIDQTKSNYELPA